jgi:hypothetical protein
VSATSEPPRDGPLDARPIGATVCCSGQRRVAHPEPVARVGDDQGRGQESRVELSVIADIELIGLVFLWVLSWVSLIGLLVR